MVTSPHARLGAGRCCCWWRALAQVSCVCRLGAGWLPPWLAGSPGNWEMAQDGGLAALLLRDLHGSHLPRSTPGPSPCSGCRQPHLPAGSEVPELLPWRKSQRPPCFPEPLGPRPGHLLLSWHWAPALPWHSAPPPAGHTDPPPAGPLPHEARPPCQPGCRWAQPRPGSPGRPAQRRPWGLTWPGPGPSLPRHS